MPNREEKIRTKTHNKQEQPPTKLDNQNKQQPIKMNEQNVTTRKPKQKTENQNTPLTKYLHKKTTKTTQT